MTDKENPWQDMPESTRRRVKSETPHSLFWITDLEGKYGFLLQSKELFDNVKSPANLKGIELLKRNSTYNFGELFLVLNYKEDWEIFYALCNDLISITDSYDNDRAMISAVEVRLKRWQQLLQQNGNKAINFTLYTQMNLFSELLCLRDIVLPKYGIEQAIVSWVGADFDKQDFLLDNAIIKVKSYETSNGQTVCISSIKQLISDKVPLFLLTYGLTQTDNGESIADIVQSINNHLKNESNEIKSKFEGKLLEYGYIPEIIKTEFYKFIVDKNRVFLTSGEFPKIQQIQIERGIVAAKYFIDLLKCGNYEQNIKNFL